MFQRANTHTHKDLNTKLENIQEVLIHIVLKVKPRLSADNKSGCESTLFGWNDKRPRP